MNGKCVLLQLYMLHAVVGMSKHTEGQNAGCIQSGELRNPLLFGDLKTLYYLHILWVWFDRCVPTNYFHMTHLSEAFPQKGKKTPTLVSRTSNMFGVNECYYIVPYT